MKDVFNAARIYTTFRKYFVYNCVTIEIALPSVVSWIIYCSYLEGGQFGAIVTSTVL